MPPISNKLKGKRGSDRDPKSHLNPANDPLLNGLLREFHSRIRRDPPKSFPLSEIVNQMKLLSRIANGISLQHSLIAGDMNVDSAIQDILRMESMTPQQLIDLDLEKVVKAIEQYVVLGSELKGDDDVKKSEEVLILKENVRTEVERIGNLEDETDKKQYFASLDKIVNVAVDGNKVDSVIKTIEDSSRAFVTFQGSSKGSSVDKSRMEHVSSELGLFEQEFNTFRTVLASTTSVATLVVEPTFLQPFLDQYHVQKKYENNQLAKETPQDLSVNMNVLSNASNIFEKSESPIIQLNMLMKSHLKHGSKNMANLKRDSTEIWIRQATDCDLIVMDNLGSSFQPLEPFALELGKVEKEWEKMKVDGTVERTEGIAVEMKQFEAVGNVSVAVGKMASCSGNGTTTVSYQQQDLDAIRLPMNTLFDRAAGFRNAAQIGDLASIQKLKGQFKADGLSDEQILTKAEELRKDSEVSKIFGNFISVAENLKQFQSFVKDRKTLIDNVKTNKTKIGNFMDGVTGSSSYSLFKCLKQVGDDGKKVKGIVELMRNLRGTNGTGTEIVMEMTKAVMSSKEGLKRAKTAGEAMRKEKNTNSAVADLMKTKGFAEGIGSAVDGLETILKLKEMKTEMGPLLGDVQFVVASADDNVRLLDTEDYNRLKAFETVKTALTSMYSEIDTAVGDIEQLKLGGLDTYADVFERAANVTSVPIDVQSYRKSLEALQHLLRQSAPGTKKKRQATAQSLSAPINSLKRLEQANLNFTNFQFASATGPLTALSTFFINYKQTVPSSRTGSGAAGGSGIHENRQAPLGGFSTGTVVIIVIVAVAVVGLLIVVVVSLVIQHKKQKEKEKKEEEEKEKKKKKKTSEETKSNSNQAVSAEIEEDVVEDMAAITEFMMRKPSDHDIQLATMPLDVTQKRCDSEKGERVMKKKKKKKVSEEKDDTKKKKAEKEMETAVEVKPAVLKDSNCYGMIKSLIISCEASSKNKTSPLGWASTLFTNDPIRFIHPPHEENHQDRRFDKPRCRKSTMVKITGFPSVYINASVCYISGVKWIMAQGPLDGTEENKVETMEKHWAMIEQHKVAVIVQLCQFKERPRHADLEHFEPEPEEKSVCAKFYPETVDQPQLECGRYRIKMVQENDVSRHFTENREMFSELQLEYTNTQNPNGSKKTLRILRFTGWPQTDSPPSPRNALEIIAYCDSYKKNIMAMCSDGAGRSGTLVGIKKAIELNLAGKPSSLTSGIYSLRISRHGAIDTPVNLFYYFITATIGIREIRNTGYLPYFEELRHIYQYVKEHKFRKKVYGLPSEAELEQTYAEEKALIISQNPRVWESERKRGQKGEKADALDITQEQEL